MWGKELRPALAAEGIVVAGCEQIDETALASVFDSEIAPVLTPLAVGPGQPFPYVSGLSLSLGVFVRDPATGEERFARVKVPETLPRLRAVADVLVPLEDVIAHFLPRLFPGMEIVGAGAVPGHAGRRLRDLRRGGRPARGDRDRAAATAVRRGGQARGRELDVPPDGRPDRPRARARGGGRLPRPGPARPRRPARADRARPPRAEGRAVAGCHDRAVRERRRVRRDPAARHRRAPPVPVVHVERRGVRADVRPGPGRARDEGDRLPDERRSRRSSPR